MKLLRIIIVSLMFTAHIAYAESSGSGLEYKVKAVVLFNFTKYVTWPKNTFASADQAINVCILGESPFGDIFNSSNAPKEAQGRPLKVTSLPLSASKDDVAVCQILYWTEKSSAAAQSLLPLLEDRGILSVSDKKSSAALISFVLVDEKVRFNIRYKAAQTLGFEMSSQLLKLATVED